MGAKKVDVYYSYVIFSTRGGSGRLQYVGGPHRIGTSLVVWVGGDEAGWCLSLCCLSASSEWKKDVVALWRHSALEQVYMPTSRQIP